MSWAVHDSAPFQFDAIRRLLDPINMANEMRSAAEQRPLPPPSPYSEPATCGLSLLITCLLFLNSVFPFVSICVLYTSFNRLVLYTSLFPHYHECYVLALFFLLRYPKVLSYSYFGFVLLLFSMFCRRLPLIQAWHKPTEYIELPAAQTKCTREYK